jgi:hypothetical protein
MNVRIVEAVVGAGFTRAKQREDYGGRDPFQMPDWTKTKQAIGDVYDESGKLIGIWNNATNVLHDMGQMAVTIEAPFEELKTTGTVLGKEFLNLKPFIVDIGTAAEKSGQKIYTAAEKGAGQVKGLAAEFRKMGLTSESVGKMFESSFMDAVGHANEGIKGMARTLVVDMVKSILQVEEKWLAAKFAKALLAAKAHPMTAKKAAAKAAADFSAASSQVSSADSSAAKAAASTPRAAIFPAKVAARPIVFHQCFQTVSTS